MDGISYFKTHPLRVSKNQRHLTIGDILKAEANAVHAQDIQPSAGAYIHYGGVELSDLLAIHKPSLTDDEIHELQTLWYASCGRVCKQLLFYVWKICAKEMRHGSSGMCDKAFANGNWDTEAVTLVRDICAGGNHNTKLEKHGNVNAGNYMDCIEQHYRKGGWGGAYGGKKWADIALQFKRYLDGEQSAMMTADRCWTLVHNTGPIFNKGFYFEHQDHYLTKILDAQASTSVFSLGEDFLDKYNHPVCDEFQAFIAKAVAALQKVIPGYTPGSTGAVNSDGTKGEAPSPSKGQANTRQIGPLVLTTATRDQT